MYGGSFDSLFCEKNGWVLIWNTDHWFYEKVLTDGTVLRTKVSHAEQKEIPGKKCSLR